MKHSDSRTKKGQGARGLVAALVIVILVALESPLLAQEPEPPCPNSDAAQIYPFDHPALSNKADFVAFTTAAALDKKDTNRVLDVYVWSRRSLKRVSLDRSGRQGRGPSRYPAITPDGRFIAFQSDAQLTDGDRDASATDVFVYDQRRRRLEQASIGLSASAKTGQDQPEGSTMATESSRPSISADGRFVAFRSTDPNLVEADDNATVDVFVRDLKRDTTVRVSVSSDGAEADDRSAGRSRGGLDISADGKYVVFESAASNLVPEGPQDPDFDSDIFIHELRTGETELVSVALDGGDGTGSALNVEGGDSLSPSISADGRRVAFASSAVNLVEGDENNQGPDGGYMTDVFVRDLTTGETERVSVGTGGTEADGPSHFPSISADGSMVSFESAATNLASGDDNGEYDVFVHNRGSGTTNPISIRDATADTNPQPRRFPLGSVSSALSPDGGTVAFASDDADLAAEDDNGVFDLFMRSSLKASRLRRLATPCSKEPKEIVGKVGTGLTLGPPSVSPDALNRLAGLAAFGVLFVFVLAVSRQPSVATLGLVVLLALSGSAGIRTARAHHYSPIQPGGQVLEEASPCSLNFVFRERGVAAATIDDEGKTRGGGRLYIGTAAHCLRDFGTDGVVGARPKIEGVGEFGTTVYGRYDLWSSRAMDFALIEIDRDKHKLVSPSLRAWGGPTQVEKTFDPGARTMYYGFGTYLRHTEPTRAKTGALEYVKEDAGPYEGWYVDDRVATGGDSGSPGLIGEDGEALGITVGLAVAFGEPGAELGPTVALILDELRLAGFDVDLVLAPFPASPVELAQHCAAQPIDDSRRGDGCIRSQPGP